MTSTLALLNIQTREKSASYKSFGNFSKIFRIKIAISRTQKVAVALNHVRRIFAFMLTTTGSVFV